MSLSEAEAGRAAELAALIASGERAAFRGRPDAGIEPLQSALGLAHALGRSPEAVAATWLLGVCLGAAGRYGDAMVILEPLAASRPQGPGLASYASLANSTLASLERQLANHGRAQVRDEVALAIAEGSSGRQSEAAFDARLGLAADAVGLGDAPSASGHLAAAEELIAPDWWRQQIRFSWVRTEVSLLTDDAPGALVAARAALEKAESSGAPRHVAKSLLFLGVSLLQSGDLPGAVSALRRATALAESLGALPLVWPSRAVLGAVLAGSDPSAASASLGAARQAVRRIADGLPPERSAEWLAKPNVATLLAS